MPQKGWITELLAVALYAEQIKNKNNNNNISNNNNLKTIVLQPGCKEPSCTTSTQSEL